MTSADQLLLLTPAIAMVALYTQALFEYPPRPSPEGWSPGDVMESIEKRGAALTAGAAPGYVADVSGGCEGVDAVGVIDVSTAVETV